MTLQESPLGLPFADHFLAVGIKSVVDDPFCRIDSLIVLIPQMPKPFGNSLEPRTFGLVVKGVIGIGPVYDTGQQEQRWVVIQVIFFDNRLERTFFPMMAEFHPGGVESGAAD